MSAKVSYNGVVYGISGSNFMRAIKLDPDFSFDKLNSLEAYMEASGIRLNPFNLDQAKDLFLGIQRGDYNSWALRSVTDIIAEYEMTTEHVTREWVIRLKSERSGKKSSNEEAYRKCKNSAPKIYSVHYWESKGLSKEDAENKVADMKVKTSGSLQRFIVRYGAEDGARRYNAFCDRIRYQNTVEYYCERYGDEGASMHADRYALVSHKHTREYHEANGTIDRYEEANRKRSINGKYESLVARHGEEVARSIMAKRAGFERVKRFKSSKEAFKFFIHLYKFLRRSGLGRDDIQWGVGDQKELQLYGANRKLPKMYDFAIPKLKIVLEYNGYAWHPDPEILSSDDLLTWTTPFGHTAADRMVNDILKAQIAEENGYKLISIWPLRDLDAQRDEIINLLKAMI